MRWAADEFPGWIEVDFVDAVGRSHRLVEKVSVITSANITAASAFPLELWLQAESERVEGGTVFVRLAEGVATTEGLDLIGMEASAVRWL